MIRSRSWSNALLCLSFTAMFVAPVSYTHLDVYKRQVLHVDFPHQNQLPKRCRYLLD